MKSKVTIRDGASYSLGKIADGLTNRRPLNAAVGKRGEVELRRHFLERNQEPNKKGWPAQNFWERVRKSTALANVDERGATIAIADAAFGGKLADHTIKPKESKYLSIPAIAEAYGRSPLTFQNLEPLIRYVNGTRRAVALAERKATAVSFGRKKVDGSRTVTRGKEVGGKVFFWLVESARQKKDPKALPSREKMEGALREEAQVFMEDLAG